MSTHKWSKIFYALFCRWRVPCKVIFFCQLGILRYARHILLLSNVIFLSMILLLLLLVVSVPDCWHLRLNLWLFTSFWGWTVRYLNILFFLTKMFDYSHTTVVWSTLLTYKTCVLRYWHLFTSFNLVVIDCWTWSPFAVKSENHQPHCAVCYVSCFNKLGLCSFILTL